MEVILELIICVLVLIFLYYKLSQRPDGLPPGDWGYPILGNLPRSKKEYGAIIQAHFKKYGGIFSVKMGSQIYVFLADFQLIKNAFSKSEFSGRPKTFSTSLQRFSSEYGLLWSESHIWESNRMFTMKTLSKLDGGKTSFEPVIRNVINTLLQELSALEGESVTIDWTLNASVLNVMLQILTGKSYQSDDNEIMEIWAKAKSNLQILEGNLKILDNFPWTARLIPNSMKNKYFHVDELKENITSIRHFIENIVDEHKRTFDTNNIRDYIDEYLLAIEDVSNVSEEDNFKEESINLTLSLLDLIVEGTYSTASILQWFLLYMISYPNVQGKIQKEIDNVFSSYQTPSLKDRKRLPYLEATLCEVNRISSLVPYGYPHEAKEDMELKGYRIPKGTYLVSCAELCHMNPDYFENPHEFLPERFLDSEGKLVTKEGYLPFSIGCRSCLGESLANMELFIFSSTILQRFKVTTSEGDTLDLTPDVHSTFVNEPKPFKIIFQKRIAEELNTKLEPITEVEPEIIPGLLKFSPEILTQGLELEPLNAPFATSYNVPETEIEPLIKKTISKVQSQNISHTHEFEPQTLPKGNGTESSTKTHSTEIKSEVNSEFTGEGSQVRQRVIVRKSQVQSKVTVVKSQTTSSSSNWSKIPNAFDDTFGETPNVQHRDFSGILNNFDGSFDQFLSPECQKPVFKSMSSNVDSHFDKSS